ncbi:MAG: T9SS type A sorting domain-containing protein [Bacteroidota bacterium]
MLLQKIKLVALFSLATLTLHAQNLISNASFEDGLSEWNPGFWGGGEANISVSAAYASEGASSAEIVVTASAPDAIYKIYVRKQSLSLDTSKEYTLSFDILSASGNEENFGVTLYSHENIGGAAWGVTFAEDALVLTGDGEWKNFSFDFVPESKAGSPDFESLGLMFGFGKAMTTYYLDNVVLKVKSSDEGDGGDGNETEVSGNVYHVSKDGNDDNDGSEAAPFLTIGKAGQIAEAGDTVLIGEGIYREFVRPSNSGKEDQMIVYKAQAGAEVLVSGMEPLSDWVREEGSIYRTRVDWNLRDDNMVMYGDQLCDLARWPNNKDNDPFTVDAATEGSGNLSQMSSSAIPNIDWANGGGIWYLGKSRWTSWRAKINSASQGKVEFQGPSGWEGNAHNPANGGEYILYGVREALDYKYEFFYDEDSKTLFLYTPNGEMPEERQVEMKRRKIGFDLNNRSYIVIDGINFHGCAVEMKGNAKGNILRNSKITWGNHTMGTGSAAFIRQQSVDLRGSDNLVERCELAWGANSGVWLAGENNTVKDCKIYNFNYLASYSAPVHVRDGSGGKVLQNTIYNAGRDAIHSVSKNVEIAYNDVFRSNLINDDCGLFYSCCGQHYSSIHHNFFHDADSRGNSFKAAGVYLDNSSQYWEVHHNVITNLEWNAFQINWDGWFIDIYNNSVWNIDKSMAAWLLDDKKLKDLRVFNNLSEEGTWLGTEIENNLVVSSSPFVNISANDFRLRSGSEAIDFGKTVEGIEMEYAGTAPDAGALEDGMPVWSPGVTWDDYVFPAATSTDEISETPLKIFPNPASDYLQLELDNSTPITLQIIDYQGKVVFSQEKVNPLKNITISHLHTGIYFVYLKQGDIISVGRFMKL